MTLRWNTLVIDCRDKETLAAWWAEALDWEIVYRDDDEVEIAPTWYAEQEATTPFHRRVPTMSLIEVPEPKTIKNRLHLDLAPHTSQDREAEIQRLLDLGATRIDIGQGNDVTWAVLADPEGNEFCVLSSRDR